jgi:hypothetical protein
VEPSAAAPGTALPAAAGLPDSCPNCGAQVHGPYCAQCGQETVITQLTLREFGHEYIQNFVSLEGRLWGTLWLLLSRPGQLTVEFLAGRRRRYVRPLPLYFSTSFVLFLLMTIWPTTLVRVDESDRPAARQAAGGPASAASAAVTLPADADVSQAPGFVQSMVKRIEASANRMGADPQKSQQRWSAAVLPKLPYAVFFLVPGFALASRLLYRRRGRTYAEHFLLSLHLHSFAFLSMTLTYWMSQDSASSILAPVWVAYLTMALRTTFGGRVLPQLGRALLLLLVEGLMLGLEMATLFVVLLVLLF